MISMSSLPYRPFVRSGMAGRLQRTGSDQFLNGKVQDARVGFPTKTLKFPRFGRPERENWAALTHEDHSGQNPFWELECSQI